MADWIIVIDDDVTTRKSAEKILRKNHMRVTSLSSGEELMKILEKGELPDLILMDVNTPGMDGFEALKNLRHLEEGRKETPVIFLTGEYDQKVEIKGFREGAMDFLRKPLDPEVLTERVQRVLRTQEKMNRFEQAAAMDKMTGLLNKETAESKIRELCATSQGYLCIMDLDSFKAINDLYGHEMGDRALELFATILKQEMRHDDICGRIGGDEFLLFVRSMSKGDELHQFIARINKVYQGEVSGLIGRQLQLGVSAGAALVPEHGRDYERLFHLADETLYSVKLNGRHGVSVAERTNNAKDRAAGELSLDTITSILEERSSHSNAMWMGTDAFINIYQYMTRYMERYHGVAYRTLFTLKIHREHVNDEDRAQVMEAFRKVMQRSLRNSDVMVEISDNQLFLLLPETKDYDIELVVKRLLSRWEQTAYSKDISVSYETGRVHLQYGGGIEHERSVNQVAVAGNEDNCLEAVRQALTRGAIEAVCLPSGEALLDYVQQHQPELILLDLKLPGLNGLQVLERLKSSTGKERDVPVLLMTTEAELETATEGLTLGAVDLIRKPFAVEELLTRVRNVMELKRLRDRLM